MAIKEFLDTGQKASGSAICWLRASTSSARTRTAEHHHPDTGTYLRQEGERIVYIRTWSPQDSTEAGRSIDTVANTGQYFDVVRAKETVSACLFARNGIRLNYMSELKAPVGEPEYERAARDGHRDGVRHLCAGQPGANSMVTSSRSSTPTSGHRRQGPACALDFEEENPLRTREGST